MVPRTWRGGAGVRPVTTEQHIITSSCGEYTRDVWLVPGPSHLDHPLAVFLDGEHYLRDMDSLPVIGELVETGATPPLSCVFVSHVRGAARHEDFVCNGRYGRFIAQDLVGWARRTN